MYKLMTPWKLLIASLLFTVAAWTPKIVYAAPLAQTQEPASNTVRLMVKIDPAAQNKAEISVLSEPSNSDNALSKMGWEVVEVDADHAQQAMAELQATPGVVEVTPDYQLELTWDPNDPGYTQGDQWAIDKIGANLAWEFSSSQPITVAVVDSGIDPNHPDLAGRTVPGYNFIDDNTDTTDLCGHGTHVSGIIAAETDNNLGVAGIAPNAVIMPVKVIGANCLGSYSRLMKGILYAVDHGVRVISITSGGAYDHSGLHDAIAYAQSKGVLVAVSAGNHGDAEPFYPGSYAESFTVAGTDVDDAPYDMSNYGEQIDISAPAVDIYSTFWNQTEGSTYSYMSGTSMAAPHVAAVAALILSIDPKLSLADLENSLISSAADLGEPGWDPIYGWGRLTAWRAVAAVTPAAGNIRLGHYRVPTMDIFALSAVTVTADSDSIDLSWSEESYTTNTSVVVYRSLVPVFEAALDVAEIDAAATGAYSDTDVEANQDYYYWLVQADNDVEVAITDAYITKLATTPQVPEEPQTPQEPKEPVTPEQPSATTMFIPLALR
jgi:subtilisin family serine protease